MYALMSVIDHPVLVCCCLIASKFVLLELLHVCWVNCGLHGHVLVFLHVSFKSYLYAFVLAVLLILNVYDVTFVERVLGESSYVLHAE
jgi:hypothetical protein